MVWAGAASEAQLRVYLAACFSALTPGRQVPFVKWAIQQLSSEAVDRISLFIWEELYDNVKRREFFNEVTGRGPR